MTHIFIPPSLTHSFLSLLSPPPITRTYTGAHLFRNLSVIGNTRSLDYLSRLAATSLGFTDGGHLSRYLIQLWSSPKGKSCGIFVIFFHVLLFKQICLISLWGVVVIFCFILSCIILCCSVLSCPVLFYPVLSCPVLPCPVLSCPALSCIILHYPVVCCAVLSYCLISCTCLFWQA